MIDFEKIKHNRKAVHLYKMSAIEIGDLDTVAKIRQFELDNFPEEKEFREERTFADKAELLFRMVKIGTDEKTAWLTYRTVQAHLKKKGSFSIKDAAEIMAKAEQIFKYQ